MEISDSAIRVLAGLLESRTGQKLADGRRWRVETTLRPLLARMGLASFDDLVGRLMAQRQGRLVDEVVEAMLNHETFFFRDAPAFQQLEEKGLARLRAARAATRRLRIWSAGCASGQEAYTLAMLIADRPDLWSDWTVEILATDLSARIIERAQAGTYSHFEIQRGLPIRQTLRHFDRHDQTWTVAPELRARVRFATHNLLDPPPPGAFDLILCRNVLFYFSPDVRSLVFHRLAGAMAADGLLMLGAGETAMGQTDAFVSDFEARGLYRLRVEQPPVARMA